MKSALAAALCALAVGACVSETDPLDGEDGANSERGALCPGADIAEDRLEATIDPVSGDEISVLVTNLDRDARPVQVELLAHLGATMPSATSEAMLIESGASAVFAFDAAELGIDADTLAVPISLKARVDALDAAGAVSERVFARADLGPSRQTLALNLETVAPGALAPSELDGPVSIGAIVAGGSGEDLIPAGDPVLVEGADAVDWPASLAIDADAIDASELIVRANSYKFCFRIPVSLSDAGYGEDYGTNPTNPWIARGLRTVVYSHGVKYFDGYLDGSGCTSTFFSGYTDQFVIFAYSYGKVAGNTLRVKDSGGSYDSMVIWGANAGSSGTKVYTLPEASVSNLLAVGGYTMARFNGGMTGETFTVNHTCHANCCDCAQDGEIWLTQDTRKFALAHEYGHTILAKWIGGYTNDCSFHMASINPNSACIGGTNTAGGHGMWSAEFASCAAMEGWAHFVAVDTFNDDDETYNPGAVIRYWAAGGDQTVNVETGPTGGVSQYYDNQCSLAIASTMGVELDWMRHWWDYHTNDTNSDKGSRPSHGQMMREIDEALAWGQDDTYDRITDGIAAESGNTQRDRWLQIGTWNGIE